MLHYPSIDPVALQLGPLQIHWYGLMYLIGFAGAWALASFRAPRQNPPWSSQEVSDLIFYAALGVLIGGRVGYMLFYNFPDWVAHPLEVFKVWQGGMSFHGGFIGVTLSLWFLARKYKQRFSTVSDFVAPLVPLGLAVGRLGNFINGELWGRETSVAWGMIFPGAGPLPRHPSQLYESLLEGVLLFMIMWFFSAKPRPRAAVSGLFIMSYGFLRFCVEFFREPDAHLGFVGLGYLTMGQLLSLPMIAVGAVILYRAYSHKEY